MKANKISDAEISALKVATLPTRPTTPDAFGGSGYTPTEVKAAFDRLPLYIIEKYNELIDDIMGEDGGDITNGMKTGINSTQTLGEFFDGVSDGTLATYLYTPLGTLAEALTGLRADIEKLAAHLGIDL